MTTNMTNIKAATDTIHDEAVQDRANELAHKEHASYSDEASAPHLHAKTWLTVLTMTFVQFALLIQLVATGAFARFVAIVVGGAAISSWMLAALTMTFVVTAPPFSQATDYWGRRWPLIILCLTGFIGVMITGRASSMGMAIVGEIFVGASFSATPLTFAVASEVLPHRHRLTGQAFLNVGGGAGAVFSLLVGAYLIDRYGPVGYRILYYINAGIYVLAALMTFVLYRPAKRPLQTSLTTKEKVFRLDWAGYAITLAAGVFFVMGLSWAENPYPWSDSHVLAPFILGTLLFGLLTLYAWRVRKDGFLHHDLFSKDRNFALAIIVILCEGLVFGTANVYVPYQCSVVYGYSTFKVSLVYATALIVYAAVSPMAAAICVWLKQVKLQVIFGMTCFLVYSILMATSSLTNGATVWGWVAILGTGLSLVLCALVTAAQLSTPPELIATTSGVVAAIRSLGVTVAVAINAAILNSKLSALPENIAAAVLKEGLQASSVKTFIVDLTSQNTTALMQVPGITPQIIEAGVLALKVSYLTAFNAVWYPAIAFSAIGIIGAVFMINPTKDLDNKIDAPVESEQDLFGKE